MRVYPDENGSLRLKAGDYGKDADGTWACRPPTKHFPGLEKQQHPLSGNLSGHQVTEHEDGTITVSPSILIQYTWGNPPISVEWHGYLERGVWREC